MRTPAHALCLSQGTAKLITWNQAVQKCDGSEFARLAARPASFVQEAVRIVDCDNHSTNSRAQNVSLDGTGPGYNLVIKYLLTHHAGTATTDFAVCPAGHYPTTSREAGDVQICPPQLHAVLHLR